MRCWVLLVVGFGACAPPPVYSVRRSSFVPLPAPPLRSGQALEAPLELALGTPNAVTAAPPTLGGDASVGVHLPRVDLNGGVRIRAGENFDIGPIFDWASPSDATSIRHDQPTPQGALFGFGVGMQYSAALSSEWRLAFGADLLLYSLPWVEVRTCARNCDYAPDTTSRGTAGIGVASLNVTPSFRIGPWVFFGGLTFRNHPLSRVGEIEVGYYQERGDEVEAGPFVGVVNFGAEASLGTVKAMMQLYQPLTDGVAAYSPTLALALSVPLGR